MSKKIKYIAAGFSNDMETLFNKFYAENSIKFESFAKCFREMNFSLIFRGRRDENETHEFLDEIYLIILNELSPEMELNRRRAAFYLLYSIYVKQPLDMNGDKRLNIKIRINCIQLIHIKQLIKQCGVSSNDLTVQYLWIKLLSYSAFDFVYYNRTNVGPDKTKYSYIYDESVSMNSMTSKLVMFINPQFNALQTIHKYYTIMKQNQHDFTVERMIPDDDIYTESKEILSHVFYVKDQSLNQQYNYPLGSELIQSNKLDNTFANSISISQRDSLIVPKRSVGRPRKAQKTVDNRVSVNLLEEIRLKNKLKKASEFKKN